MNTLQTHSHLILKATKKNRKVEFKDSYLQILRIFMLPINDSHAG